MTQINTSVNSHSGLYRADGKPELLFKTAYDLFLQENTEKEDSDANDSRAPSNSNSKKDGVKDGNEL